MKENKLTIQIHRSVDEVFKFCITPPDSTLWIPEVVVEQTNELPVRIGTVYKLQNENGEISEVIVSDLKENERVEWVSKDQNYHCRYTFKKIGENTTEFEYRERVDNGEIEKPFTLDILKKLKTVLESSKDGF